MTPTPIILDCDPGDDDMVAILLAAANPAIDLRAITTVAGNASLPRVTDNARATCTLAGIDGVPIAPGADGPLLGVAQRELAAAARMAQVLEDADGPMTICAIGPLTNVAILLQTHPGLVTRRVAELVVMGGTLGAGGIAPPAEFNVRTDPEAAAIVLDSGVAITLCPLDLTLGAPAAPAVLARLRALGTPLAATVAGWLRRIADRYRDAWGMPDPPLHDPVTVAHLIDPSLLELADAHVAIELRATHTRGATTCDRLGVTGRAPNAKVATGIDAARYWDVVVDAVDRLGRTSSLPP